MTRRSFIALASPGCFTACTIRSPSRLTCRTPGADSTIKPMCGASLLRATLQSPGDSSREYAQRNLLTTAKNGGPGHVVRKRSRHATAPSMRGNSSVTRIGLPAVWRINNAIKSSGNRNTARSKHAPNLSISDKQNGIVSFMCASWPNAGEVSHAGPRMSTATAAILAESPMAPAIG